MNSSMVTSPQLQPIRREVVVPVGREAAFDMFTRGIDRWWPRHHHIGATDPAEFVLEPREGGRWYARHVDGSETNTGFVMTWEPPERVVLAWQLTADWQFDATFFTPVEVRFVAEAPDRTRVALVHSELERYGPQAERMRAMFDQPGAWEGTLLAFADRVSRHEGA
jgi:uncharacterized protein YndB with AHSA1/START domain